MRHIPPLINRSRARDMRADATQAENFLWQALRNRQLEGYKFRRQVPLHNFILDFVCFERQLIVEVDGFQHAENTRDAARDALLLAKGFRTMRFWNEEVQRNLNGVCLAVLAELRNTGE